MPHPTRNGRAVSLSSDGRIVRLSEPKQSSHLRSAPPPHGASPALPQELEQAPGTPRESTHFTSSRTEAERASILWLASCVLCLFTKKAPWVKQ